jgi:MFS family permease
LLGEITDDSNRAKGFMLWCAADSLGVMVGPIIGGLLVSQDHPLEGGSFLAQNPFFLPCAVSSAFSLSCALIVAIYLQEVSPFNEIVPLLQEHSLNDNESIDMSSSEGEIHSVDPDRSFYSSRDRTLRDKTSIAAISFHSVTSVASRLSLHPSTIYIVSIRRILTPKVRRSVALYATWCLIIVIYEEVVGCH